MSATSSPSEKRVLHACTLDCEACSQPFEPVRRWQRFCSSSCRYDAANRRRQDESPDRPKPEFAAPVGKRLDEQWREKFNVFSSVVSERLEAGARAYGDESFGRPPTELVREIEGELLDVCAWSFILWCQIRRVLGGLAGENRGEQAPVPPGQSGLRSDEGLGTTTGEKQRA
jgi:hypothetical protein